MDVHVHLGGRGQLSEQIFRQLFEAILDGRLRPGSRLPPTRELAARLAVSRNTVGVAYERLLAEGVTLGRVGSGTYVAEAPAPRIPATYGARRPCYPRAGAATSPSTSLQARRTTPCFRSPPGGGS